MKKQKTPEVVKDIFKILKKNAINKELKEIFESIKFEPVDKSLKIIKKKSEKAGFHMENLNYNVETHTLTGTVFHKIEDGVMGSFDVEVEYK